MSNLPPLYQRLIEARDAFWNVHHYQTPREALGHSQALVDKVNGLIDTFLLNRQMLRKANSVEVLAAMKTQMRQNLDAYLLDVRELVKRLEAHTEELGLEFYVDALDQLITSEIDVSADSVQAGNPG